MSNAEATMVGWTYVENMGAQTSASWLSGGPSQRQSTPQAAPSFGQSAAWAALAGHIGLVLDIVGWTSSATQHSRKAGCMTATRVLTVDAPYLVRVEVGVGRGRGRCQARCECAMRAARPNRS